MSAAAAAAAAAGSDRRLRVDHAGGSYDVVIGDGLLDRAGETIGAEFKGRWRRAFILTDTCVASLYLERLAASLDRAEISAHICQIDEGEGSKSLAVLERVIEDFIGHGAERDDLVIALGGGIIGDLAGLTAGLLKRGAAIAHIPTTLLAQVDSAIGGKTAVNSRHGKNLIGLFHQPVLVMVDPGLLASLPRRQLCAGLAEVVKCALLGDRAFFETLRAQADLLVAGQPEALVEALLHACRIKAGLVAADERERGDRALLNLGHSFAHALEAVNAYRPSLLHGEAVGCGLRLCFAYSVRAGFCPPEEADLVASVLKSLGLAGDIASLGGGPYDAARLFAAMKQDKKAKDGVMTLILAAGIGDAFVHPVARPDDVMTFLAEQTE